jgi:hypothetical protein
MAKKFLSKLYPALNDKAYIESLYREHSSRGIAAIIGCSRETALHVIRFHGIERRPVGFQSAGMYPNLDDREWLESRYRDHSQLEIAEEIGCCKATIRKALRRHRIPASPVGVNMRYERVHGQQKTERYI